MVFFSTAREGSDIISPLDGHRRPEAVLSSSRRAVPPSRQEYLRQTLFSRLHSVLIQMANIIR